MMAHVTIKPQFTSEEVQERSQLVNEGLCMNLKNSRWFKESDFEVIRDYGNKVKRVPKSL